MSDIISIISQKGGVGKSTVTTLLANIFYFHFKFRVALIDADFPQVSIGKRRDAEMHLVHNNKRLQKAYASLYQDREPYPILKTDLKNCPTILKELEGHYDYIFVDVTGSINQNGIVEFLHLANYFFVPVLQDNFSMTSALEFFGAIGRVKMQSENFKGCKLFFNRVPAMNRVKALTESMNKQVDILDDYLSAYTVYERLYRSTLFPIPKRNDKPSQKIFQFAESVLRAMNDENTNRENLKPENIEAI